MLGHRNLFRRNNHNEDETVQITNANSLLGTHLLEGDWDELLEHLATPEGERDVAAENDPIGLFNNVVDGGGSSTCSTAASNNNNHGAISIPPSSHNTAFFAALYVRAPLAIIEAIYNLSRERVHRPEELMYVLAVIPSEEKERLRGAHDPRRIPYRTRTWTPQEYEALVKLLLEDTPPSNSSSTTSPLLLRLSPSWIISTCELTSLTPLAIAAYNPDISSNLLRFIYSMEPRAVDVECQLFGVSTIPLHIAAASPLPPKQTSSTSPLVSADYYYEVERNRWEKVEVLLACGFSELSVVGSSQKRDEDAVSTSMEYTKEDATNNTTNDMLDKFSSTPAPASASPTSEQILHACKEAIQRGEWELVREFLKHYYHPQERARAVKAQLESNEIGVGEKGSVPIAVAVAEPTAAAYPPSSSMALEPIHTALMQHDQRVQSNLQHCQKAREKEHARDDWMRKNMGLAMYPIDVVVDLASVVIPSSWLRRRKKQHYGDDGEEVGRPHGIVGPMS